MKRELIGIKYYLYSGSIEEKQKIEQRKKIEQNVFNATITERFINNGYAFEAQRPKVVM